MSMPRRPFDASFSRRPGHGSGPGGGLAPSAGPISSVSSLMGEYGGGRRGGGYQDEGEEVEQPSRVSRNSGGLYRGAGREEDFDYDAPRPAQLDRVPREGGGGSRGQGQGARLPPQTRHREEFDDYRGTGGGGGGWRQRSPSPSRRFTSSRDHVDGDFGDRSHRGSAGSSWTTRGGGSGGDYLDETDFIGGGGRSSASNLFDNSSASSNFRQAQQDLMLQQQQRVFANSAGILRNADPIVKVLLQPGGGLMGNMGLNNPFGMLGASPTMMVGGLPAFANASPFGQPQLLQQQSSSSIYGSQTQQAFDRSRNLITASDNNSRRNDFYRGGRGGGGGGRRSESDRNRNDSASRNDSPRKRNLVLRDPHPEEGIKRPRISAGGGGIGNNRKSGGQVKRNDILGGGGKKSIGSSHRPASSGKDAKKDKDKSSTTAPPDEGVEIGTESKTGDDKEKTKPEQDKDRKTEYDDIPGALLVCKVCQKSMNDGQSFESHLSGRAHQSLLKIMEERMSKRVELLMNESKCAEDEIGIEMDRQRRAGVGRGRAEKKPNNYCKMCDCYYAMNWGAHKVSLGHRILKAFLHPTCQFCKTHFMHRRDWVIHLTTAAHMKKLVELKEEQGSSPLLEEQESPLQDELFTIYFDRSGDERTTNVLTIKSKDGRESLTEEMKEILKNDRGEIVLPDGAIPLPKEYSSELTVGADAVVAVDGNRCRVCRVYIPADKNVDSHCSSKEHFNQYVSFLKRVNAFREHKERDRKEAEEKAKADEERRKRREEEKAKAEAAKLEKAEADAKNKATNGEGSETKMEVDADGEVKIEPAGDSSEEKKVVEVVDVDDEPEVEDEVDDEEEEENEDDILEDEDDEEEDEEEAEGEDAFIPNQEAEAPDTEVDAPDAGPGPEGVEMTEEPGVPDQEESFATIVAVTSTATSGVSPPLSSQELNTNGNQVVVEEEQGHDEESNDSVEIVPVAPAIVRTPATARRGRGGRGKPAGTPALRNVQAKVDTNMRGGRGRGSPRAKSVCSRGRGRGAR